MWISLALLSAAASAATTMSLKTVVARGGIVVPIAGYRGVAGLVLAAIVVALGLLPEPTAAYLRLTGLMVVPEVAGVLCMAAALRRGELSRVQPLFGTLPVFVMLSGMIVLGEMPTAVAALGVVLVAMGLYVTGLRRGASWAEPLRELARTPASWYALAASVAWTFATMVHKAGIAEVGPLPWAMTICLASSVGVLVASWVAATVRRFPDADGIAAGTWRRIALTGAVFAVQQIGLQLALRDAPAAYVTALTATSTVLATLLGIVALRERSAPGRRLAAAAMVAAGAVLIALGR
ncbi:MAG TPA: EamA family transporter [Gemmatimonadaceae bacterium]|nr:EamA family transporter [Gemmatimonadaceae bacterium]